MDSLAPSEISKLSGETLAVVKHSLAEGVTALTGEVNTLRKLASAGRSLLSEPPSVMHSIRTKFRGKRPCSPLYRPVQLKPPRNIKLVIVAFFGKLKSSSYSASKSLSAVTIGPWVCGHLQRSSFAHSGSIMTPVAPEMSDRSVVFLLTLVTSSLAARAFSLTEGATALTAAAAVNESSTSLAKAATCLLSGTQSSR
ncbi:hypothetical protein BDV96DRAFT_573952 [Lophiotrema nucula]|uniref:Uncharacterized protein n=1 Tax=Lophiotrema nucula TaxID=690887 RepID=A0A6A5ZAV3_9PLEO|nr:hypothetical protein BDV96DRAFT_573952 [Lophiotrema nucula]